MPLRSYHAHSQPPSRLDHALAHPWETGISVFQIIGGTAGLLTTVIPGWTISASLDALPNLLVAALCGMMLAGGVFAIGGIYDDNDDLMIGYRRERLGLILGSTAWLVYGVVVVAAFPWSIMGWSFGFFLGACGVLRLWATYREEHRLRGIDPPTPPPIAKGGS